MVSNTGLAAEIAFEVSIPGLSEKDAVLIRFWSSFSKVTYWDLNPGVSTFAMLFSVTFIDDDEITLDLVQALMEDDYTIIKMKSGVQALAQLKEDPDVDVILLDMMMPDLDGMKVLSAIKEDKRLSLIPVILLTSLEGINFEAEGYISGASGYVRKPIHAGLLKLKIQRQIYFSKLKREHAIYKQRLGIIKKLLENIDIDIDNLNLPENDSEDL